MKNKTKISCFSFLATGFIVAASFGAINSQKSMVKAEDGFNLTINYVDALGTKVAEPYVETLAEGTKYNVNSPSVNDLTPLKPFVKGRLFEDTEIDVVYDTYDTWDGTSSEDEFDGEGTEASPYLIQSAEDLARLATTTTTTTSWGGFILN